MKVRDLVPEADQKSLFSWKEERTLPSEGGNYAIATFDYTLLYVGLATNIRSRVRTHLESPEKRNGSEEGKPYWLFYRIERVEKIASVERGWMNQCLLEDGCLPYLNKRYGQC